MPAALACLALALTVAACGGNGSTQDEEQICAVGCSKRAKS